MAVETIGDDPSSDNDPTVPDLWLFGAEVIGGGGGADEPVELVPYCRLRYQIFLSPSPTNRNYKPKQDILKGEVSLYQGILKGEV